MSSYLGIDVFMLLAADDLVEVVDRPLDGFQWDLDRLLLASLELAHIRCNCDVTNQKQFHESDQKAWMK